MNNIENLQEINQLNMPYWKIKLAC
jgi:hypothetical protein